jgi:hypothetical protein
MGLLSPSNRKDQKQNESGSDPTKFRLIKKAEFKNSYILAIIYENCFGFERTKIFVFMGTYYQRYYISTHFENSSDSHIASFKPNRWDLAIKFARSL